MAVVNLSGSIINPVQQFGGNMASLKVGEGIFNNILKTINRIVYLCRQTKNRYSFYFHQLKPKTWYYTGEC